MFILPFEFFRGQLVIRAGIPELLHGESHNLVQVLVDESCEPWEPAFLNLSAHPAGGRIDILIVQEILIRGSVGEGTGDEGEEKYKHQGFHFFLIPSEFNPAIVLVDFL